MVTIVAIWLRLGSDCGHKHCGRFGAFAEIMLSLFLVGQSRFLDFAKKTKTNLFDCFPCLVSITILYFDAAPAPDAVCKPIMYNYVPSE